MEDSMEMDMSLLRPQNYLFGCELRLTKIITLRWIMMKMSTMILQLKCGLGTVHISGQHLVAVEEDAESEGEEEEDVKLLSISGKQSAPGGGSEVPQKKVKLAAEEDDDDDDEEDEDDDEDNDDNDEDDEEAEEKAPVKKSIQDTPAKNVQKSNQNGKDSKPSSTPRSKGQESFKKQEKTPKTPKGPSSVEDIKAKMQASTEKGDSLPKVAAKFISYVKNCFRMTDQEAIQDLWQWRNLNNLLKIFHLISFL
uniref:Nucleophosmin n=1 Tax=Gorilla gorilla gorilla TaxID=9595 RepID=G3S2E7_GORGO